jgi:hypothetical protein
VLARRLLAALALLPLAATPPATADPAPHTTRAAVTVSVPDSLVEGDRFNVTVHVSRTHDARRVLLQRSTLDYTGNRRWETVAKAKVHGHTRSFAEVAGTDDVERYRARVEYARGRPARSRSASAVVWHWGSMMQFTAYAVSNGISSNGSNQFRMNGTEYHGGWFASYGDYVSWDLRFTPGRHCRAFRGVVGHTDASADGASAQLQLVADDVVAYASPPLTPGMSQPFVVDIATPYRLYIQAQRTSPTGQRAYPAIGDPELLCTGLAD